jgi:AcrR family transcriptional regulator
MPRGARLMVARSPKARVVSQISKRRVAARNENSEYYTEKRVAMLRAAATLFKEKGLSATSLVEVARLAGLDRSTLYYYVSSREELFFEVVGDAMDTVADKAEAIEAGPGSAVEKFEKLLVAQMAHYAANYPHLYVFLAENMASVMTSDTRQKKRLVESAARFEKVFRTIVAEGVADGTLRADLSPTIMSNAALGMSNWTHRWFVPDGPLTGEELGKAFASIMLNGIRKA